MSGAWEIGQRAQYVARTPTAPGRFAVLRGAVEVATGELVAVRWDSGGLGRFAPDELDRLTVEGSAEAHRAVFGPDVALPGDLLDRVTDAHGTTIADEVDVDCWAWNDPDTERRMQDLVAAATEVGVWGRRRIGLDVLPDYDDPAWCSVWIGLPDGFRLAADIVELRDLLAPGPDARHLTGRDLADRFLSGVEPHAVALAQHAARLDLELDRPTRPRPAPAVATPAATTPAAAGPAGPAGSAAAAAAAAAAEGVWVDG